MHCSGNFWLLFSTKISLLRPRDVCYYFLLSLLLLLLLLLLLVSFNVVFVVVTVYFVNLMSMLKMISWQMNSFFFVRFNTSKW